jgi:hypothetical protein
MREIIRPGPGIPAWPSRNSIIRPSRSTQSGPAGIRQKRPGKKSRPGRILLIRPSRGAVEDGGLLEGAQPEEAQAGLAGAMERRAQAGQPAWRPSRDAKGAQGRRGPRGESAGRPSRGAVLAHAGEEEKAHAGERPTWPSRHGGRPGRLPSRGSGLPAQPDKLYAGPASLYAGLGTIMPAQDWLSRPRLLLNCLFNILHTQFNIYNVY